MRQKKEKVRRIAGERMRILYKEAKKTLKKDSELSKRYVELMKKIGTKNRTRIPKNIKFFICKKCNKIQRPGYNLRTRLKKGVMIMKCECGAIKRRPYTREKRVKRH